MAYYAVQDGQVSPAGKQLVSAPAVVHEFSTKRMRDEWVRRGELKGRSHRRAIPAAKARAAAVAPVRHRGMGAKANAAGTDCRERGGEGNA